MLNRAIQPESSRSHLVRFSISLFVRLLSALIFLLFPAFLPDPLSLPLFLPLSTLLPLINLESTVSQSQSKVRSRNALVQGCKLTMNLPLLLDSTLLVSTAGDDNALSLERIEFSGKDELFATSMTSSLLGEAHASTIQGKLIPSVQSDLCS